MDKQKLNSAIAEFTKEKKSNAAFYEENWAERKDERKERKEYYQSLYQGQAFDHDRGGILRVYQQAVVYAYWGQQESNAAVQAVVAVADEEQLTKIISESAGVIDEKS